VLAGWGLVVIYDEPTEPFRTINFFEGFQNFWGSSITLSPSNFVIPPGAIDGKLGVLSWEGDAGNSGRRNGVRENLFFDGQNTPRVILRDALNPVNNQFNSTINSLGITNSYGVDFDTYDISSRLRAGDTTASTLYQSGQDRVFLSLEIISVTNTPAIDFGIAMSQSGAFVPGKIGQYQFTATNNGPLTYNGMVSVTHTLPTGLTFNGFSSTDANWSCTGIAVVVCQWTGIVNPNVALAPVTLRVDIATTAINPLNITAAVAITVFDPISSNDTANLSITLAPQVELSKTVTTLSDPTGATNPKAIPGAMLEYSIAVVNSGPGDADSIIVVDDLPPAARLVFDVVSNDPIRFSNGAIPSGLTYVFGGLADNADDIEFSNDGGATTIVPTIDTTTGLDTTNPRINHLRITPNGTLTETVSAPSFTLQLTMQLD
jgi:uncharacterized repeat protein (TIGR01451 family)